MRVWKPVSRDSPAPIHAISTGDTPGVNCQEVRNISPSRSLRRSTHTPTVAVSVTSASETAAAAVISPSTPTAFTGHFIPAFACISPDDDVNPPQILLGCADPDPAPSATRERFLIAFVTASSSAPVTSSLGLPPSNLLPRGGRGAGAPVRQDGDPHVGKQNCLVIPNQHAEKHFQLQLPSTGGESKGVLLNFEDAGVKV